MSMDKTGDIIKELIRLTDEWYLIYCIVEYIFDKGSENVEFKKDSINRLFRGKSDGDKFNSLIKYLSDIGYITLNEEDEKAYIVSFTEEGSGYARRTIRKQRIMELFLHNTTLLQPEDIHEEAAKMSFSLNKYLENTFYRILNNPKVCVHGNTIPVEDIGESLDSIPLYDTKPGDTVIVQYFDRRFHERGGGYHKMREMERMMDLGIIPNWPMKVLDRIPGHGPIIVELNGRKIAIGRGMSRKIFVTPLKEE